MGMLIRARSESTLAHHSVSITIEGVVIPSGRPRLGVKPPILQSVKYWSRRVWNGRKWTVKGGLKGQLSTDQPS